MHSDRMTHPITEFLKVREVDNKYLYNIIRMIIVIILINICAIEWTMHTK